MATITPTTTTTTEPLLTSEPSSLQEVTPVMVETEVESIEISEEEVFAELEYVELGTYRVTAYCACEICCGEWALNRPDGIVYGAAMIELQSGISCASPLPFGTVLEIENYGQVVVHDRIAQWVLDKHGYNCVDIYFDSHEMATAFAMQFLNVKEVLI